MKIEIPDVRVHPDRPFFNRGTGRQFRARATGQAAEIDLYDEIGFWGVTAKEFRKQLNAIDADEIRLRINSPGGDVFDGIAMHNDLLAHPAKVSVEVIGLAASAASIIAMAGDEITMAENAFFMIHNAWGFAVGNKNDLSDLAATLDKIDGALARTYAKRTGMSVKTIATMMDAETWFAADEAEDQGFIDSIANEVEVSARFDLSVFANIPDGVPAIGERAAPDVTPKAMERALRDAGFSRSQAKELTSKALSTPDDSLCDAGKPDGFTAALKRLHESMNRRA